MEKSAEALKALLCDFSQSESKYRAVLQEYVCVRFGLDNESEENIGALAILSIRKQYPDMQKEEAAKRLGNYDCHRITYAVQKKILMLMELEKITNTHIPDDTEDTASVASYIYSQKKEACHV
jgi:hypothetical protein